MGIVSFFILLLIGSLAVTSTSTESTPSPTPQITMVYDIFQSETWGNRLFSINTNSLVTTDIRNHPATADLIKPAFDYIDIIWKAVKKRRDNKDFRACNLYQIQNKLNAQDWPNMWRQRANLYQLGTINTSCYSSMDVTQASADGELPLDTAKNAPKVFTNANEGFNQAFTRLKIRPDGNWSKDGKSYNMTSRIRVREAQNCLVRSIIAHQKNGTWFLRGQVTNRPVQFHTKSYERHFLFEHVPREGNESLKITFPNRKNGRIERGTTVMSTWGGFGFAIESEFFDDPTGPLYKAYQENTVSVDLASDSITGSNIAILALPMVMNFIPSACLADIHTYALVLYIMVTDIFSTIPFLIKGVELIQSSIPNKKNVFAYISGDEHLGTMQSWSVQCMGQSRFRNTGIAFVIFGTLAIIMGISLELWARRYMKKMRIRAKQHELIKGPFGQPYVDFYTHSYRRETV